MELTGPEFVGAELDDRLRIGHRRDGSVSVVDRRRTNRRTRQLVPALSVLGAGIGAAIGTMTDTLGTGIWIGGAIGAGLARLIGVFMNA